MEIADTATLRSVVTRLVNTTPVLDIHTHIFEESFGDLLLRGPEALITYHYLQAETNRVLDDMTPAQWMALSTPAQAHIVWRKLFVERSPISEAARGVVTAWNRLGVPSVRDYDGVLKHFAGLSAGQMIDLVFTTANVRGVVMTNDPFHPGEQAVWNNGKKKDARFRAALRIDPRLLDWPAHWQRVQQMGYSVSRDLPESGYAEVARFLKDWAAKMKPAYMAASLPPSFHHARRLPHRPRPGAVSSARLPRPGHPVRHDDRRQEACHARARRRRRRRGAGQSRQRQPSLPRISAQQVPADRPGPREPPRSDRAGAQVPQLARLWLLVVQ